MRFPLLFLLSLRSLEDMELIYKKQFKSQKYDLFGKIFREELEEKSKIITYYKGASS